MGIEPYLISSTVAGVMAQRLVRVICSDCKQAYSPQDGTVSWTELQNVAKGFVKLYKGSGCEKCLGTGYMGRTGIFELLLVDDGIRDLIVRRQGSHIIEQAAVANGMVTLRQDGLRRALAGATTLEEVYRVTQDSVQLGAEGS
jgi:general secretion pathway protein E